MGTAAGNADMGGVPGGLSQYKYFSCEFGGSAVLVGSLGGKRPRAYAYNGLCQTHCLRLDGC
jgi:hypothetical protein